MTYDAPDEPRTHWGLVSDTHLLAWEADLTAAPVHPTDDGGAALARLELSRAIATAVNVLGAPECIREVIASVQECTGKRLAIGRARRGL